MAKRSNTRIPPWMGEAGEPFLRVPNSFMDSQAWKHLTARQRVLLLAMERHYKGGGAHREVAKKYPDVPELQREDLFFYSWTEAFKSGLYGKSGNNDKAFYGDVDALIKHGFIKRILRGWNRRMTIYQYSPDWKKWKPPPN